MARFVFFKMQGCGPCMAFQGQRGAPNPPGTPDDPNSPWHRLENDQELKSLGVVFDKIEWERSKGVGATHPQYAFVTYGPYLWLETLDSPKDKPVGFEYPSGPRDFDRVKNWIKEKLQKEPAFNKGGNATKTVIKTAVPTPTNQPAQQTKVTVVVNDKTPKPGGSREIRKQGGAPAHHKQPTNETLEPVKTKHHAKKGCTRCGDTNPQGCKDGNCPVRAQVAPATVQSLPVPAYLQQAMTRQSKPSMVVPQGYAPPKVSNLPNPNAAPTINPYAQEAYERSLEALKRAAPHTSVPPQTIQPGPKPVSSSSSSRSVSQQSVSSYVPATGYSVPPPPVVPATSAVQANVAVPVQVSATRQAVENHSSLSDDNKALKATKFRYKTAY